MFMFRKFYQLPEQKCPVVRKYFNRPSLLAVYKNGSEKVSRLENVKHFHLPMPNRYPIRLNDYPPKLHDSHDSRHMSYPLEEVFNWLMTDEINKFKSSLGNKTCVYTTESILNYLLALHVFHDSTENCWILSIARFGGDLYIDGIEVKKNVSDIEETKLSQVENIFYSDVFHTQAHFNNHPKNFIAYEAIYHCALDKFNIIYSSPMPAIIAYNKVTEFTDLNSLNNCNFVMTHVESPGLHATSKRQMFLRLWYKAHLLNIKYLYEVKIDNSDVIRDPIKYIKIKDIPKMHSFVPGHCNGLLYNFLEKVEQLMADVDSLETEYSFRYNPYQKRMEYVPCNERPVVNDRKCAEFLTNPL